MSFVDLGLSEPLLRALAAEGYSSPTPIQAQAIPPALAGDDVLGVAQTGTGKTAAFALPLLHRVKPNAHAWRDARRTIQVLVLAPTRELAAQIGDSFAVYGRHTSVKTGVIFGGVGYQKQIQQLRRGVDILVATPGRLVDLMQQGYVDFTGLQTFVLDEADRMLDMGFLPDLKRIIAELPTERQTLFFSATMPPEIAGLADDLLTDPVRIAITPQKPAGERIAQEVCFVPRSHKTRLLVSLLDDETVDQAIVFTRTKHGADRVAEQLNDAGVRAEAIHGNKSQNARQRTLHAFRENVLRVLVATDLAARGIDVDGISHVFNYDLPIEAETYVHRIGRTARAGASGSAMSFCSPEERGLLKAIERLLNKAIPIATELPVEIPKAQPAPSRPDGDRRGPPRSGRPGQRPGSPHAHSAPGKHRRPVKKVAGRAS